MDIIQPGHWIKYLLESNLSLTVTVMGTGAAYVDKYRRDKLIDQTTITSGSQTFGPYNFDLSLLVNATGCVVNVTKQEAIQALGAADA